MDLDQVTHQSGKFLQNENEQINRSSGTKGEKEATAVNGVERRAPGCN